MEGLTGLNDFAVIMGKWITGLQGFWVLLNKPIVDIIPLRWLYFFADDYTIDLINNYSLLDFILYSAIAFVVIHYLIKFLLSVGTRFV